MNLGGRFCWKATRGVHVGFDGSSTGRFARCLPLHKIPPSRLEQKNECLPLRTLSSSLGPVRNIDDIVEKTIRINAGLDAVKSERCVWNPGFVA